LDVAPTAMETNLIDLDVAVIRMIEDGAFQIDVVPRVLIDELVDITGSPSTPITYDDGTTTVDVSTDLPFPYFIKTGGVYNLGYDNVLLNDYGYTLIGILTNTKKFTGLFNLKTTDFNKFNHLTPIYLDQHGAYFYANKVMDYKKGFLTKMELIRI